MTDQADILAGIAQAIAKSAEDQGMSVSLSGLTVSIACHIQPAPSHIEIEFTRSEDYGKQRIADYHEAMRMASRHLKTREGAHWMAAAQSAWIDISNHCYWFATTHSDVPPEMPTSVKLLQEHQAWR